MCVLSIREAYPLPQSPPGNTFLAHQLTQSCLWAFCVHSRPIHSLLVRIACLLYINLPYSIETCAMGLNLLYINGGFRLREPLTTVVVHWDVPPTL